MDHLYEILRLIRVKFACFVPGVCVGTSFVSLLNSGVVPFTCSAPMLLNHSCLLTTQSLISGHISDVYEQIYVLCLYVGL